MFLHSQRRSSEIYTPVMKGVYDTCYDDKRGLIGRVRIGLEVFIRLIFFARLWDDIFTVIYPFLSAIIIAT